MTSMTLTSERVLQVLRGVIPAGEDADVVSAGMISGVTVRRMIAVASGKGGVGKSTTAAALAVAAARAGLRAGLLDADIYGPSVPRLMGLRGSGQPVIEAGKMIPPGAHGVACMSMGFVTG